ncbi:MAG: GMP reductase [Deltaproteobacteria bacterium]|nr:GMP reductase [Deltaproteobacteria bacterium]
MRIDTEPKLGFKDVLIRPKRSTLESRSDVSLSRQFTFKHAEGEWNGVPIMIANMDTVGTFRMAKSAAEFQILTTVHKHYSLQEWGAFLKKIEPAVYDYVAISLGISNKEFAKLEEIMGSFPQLRFICIDVANGYTERFVEFVRKVRASFPTKIIIAGNVVTGEMVEELVLSGADIIKVGIGPGSVCTTRIKTGVGYPQLSAIIECADAAHGLKGQVVSDGGCTCPGDIAKAFGAGADFVMLGGMFAGHDECDGEVVEQAGQKLFRFYGMSSDIAMERHNGGVADYRASEGKSVLIPYRGPVSNTIKDLLGGVRSACTYVGAAKLKELSKRTTFIIVGEQENRIFAEK